LAAALFPVCALIIVLAPSLPRDILGSKWTGTEDLIRILALVVLIGIYGEIAVTVFKGFGRPYVIAILELMQSSITITAVWLLTPYFGLLGAALAWLPSILFSQIISMRFLQGILDHPFRSLSKPLMAIITITGTCAAIALATRNLIPGIVGFITSGVLGIVSAAVLLWIADRQLQLGFVTTLTMVFREK
jgi:O-antigen/teichoic acid export membrane protein